MKHNYIWPVVILFTLAGCAQPAAAPTPTRAAEPATPPPATSTQPIPTDTTIPTDTSVPTNTPLPPCSLARPEYEVAFKPGPSKQAGWCQVDYGLFNVTYPEGWLAAGSGAWMQILSFEVPLTSARPPWINVMVFDTGNSLDHVDETIVETREGGQRFYDPVVAPEEVVVDRAIRTIGDAEVLVLTTTQTEKTITQGEETLRHYFWQSPRAYGRPGEFTYLELKVQAPSTDFASEEYPALLQKVEEVVGRFKPIHTCADGFTRLYYGIQARVTEGNLPNRVRSEPKVGAEMIAQIYAGTIVDVRQGPVCADGHVYWKVNQKDIPGGSGWTSEGNFSEYFLEPYWP